MVVVVGVRPDDPRSEHRHVRVAVGILEPVEEPAHTIGRQHKGDDLCRDETANDDRFRAPSVAAGTPDAWIEIPASNFEEKRCRPYATPTLSLVARSSDSSPLVFSL